MAVATLARVNANRSRTPQQLLGDQAEQLVAERLGQAEWRVLGRNVRVGRLEIDIVAEDPGPPAALVIVEVRWRARRDFGLPEETVDHRKRSRLRAAAFQLLDRGSIGGVVLPKLSLRIDLVVVEPPTMPGGELRVRHYRAAG